jgi:DNA-binding beta-propeller fold protein YncE
VIFNNSLVPGNFLASDGLNPEDVAYDPITGMIYISEQGTGVVSIVNPATNLVVGGIQLEDAGAMAFDSGKGELFVAGYGGVAVLNMTSNTEVANFSILGGITGLAYDSGKNEIFASDFETDNVSVISDSTNTIVAEVPVEVYPGSITYDSANGEIFVANAGYSTPNATVINDTSNSVIATFPTGPQGNAPGYVQYDPVDRDVYASASDNVSVLSGASYAVYVNYTLNGYVTGFAYDSGKQEVFASTSDGNLTVFNAVNNSLIGNISLPSSLTGFGALGYDSAMGEILVTGATFTVEVVSDSTNTVAANITVGYTPYATAFDSGKNELFVTSWQYGEKVAIISTTTDQILKFINVDTDIVDAVYDSARGEVFFAGDSGISVVNDTNDSVVATIPVYAGGAGMAYDRANGEIFLTGGFDGVLVVLNDTDYSVTTPLAYPDAYAVAYDSELGQVFISTYALGNISGYNVTILNATTLAFVANVTLPGEAYLLGYDSGRGEVFAATTLGDALYVAVISDSTDSMVADLDVGSLVYGFAYDAAQGEAFATNFAKGDGHVWANVTVISDATNTLLPTVPVGTAPAGASFDPATDQVFVANYFQGTISIISQLPAYTATFTETGLTSGTDWSVVLNGTTGSSSGGSIVFDVANGTLPFTVNSVTGYTLAPTSGNIVVNGDSPTQPIQFTSSSGTGTGQTKFPVTFSETGLTVGTTWTVTLNGTPLASTSSSIVFQAANGTEEFTVGTVSGFTASLASGSVTIAGKAVSESIQFTTSSTSLPVTNGTSGGSSTVLGLPPVEGYLLILLIIAILGIIAALVVRSRRRGKANEAPASPGAPPTTPPGAA